MALEFDEALTLFPKLGAFIKATQACIAKLPPKESITAAKFVEAFDVPQSSPIWLLADFGDDLVAKVKS